jgi:hypothetical protein
MIRCAGGRWLQTLYSSSGKSFGGTPSASNAQSVSPPSARATAGGTGSVRRASRSWISSAVAFDCSWSSGSEVGEFTGSSRFLILARKTASELQKL